MGEECAVPPKIIAGFGVSHSSPITRNPHFTRDGSLPPHTHTLHYIPLPYPTDLTKPSQEMNPLLRLTDPSHTPHRSPTHFTRDGSHPTSHRSPPRTHSTRDGSRPYIPQTPPPPPHRQFENKSKLGERRGPYPTSIIALRDGGRRNREIHINCRGKGKKSHTTTE